MKRSTDTRVRREVVGQLLDYAANGVTYWPVQQLVSSFEETCRAAGQEADEVLEQFLENGTADEFWARVKTNLQAGKIRLVFLADSVPRELQRVVEFLNEQMDPAEALAVEVKRYLGDRAETLVPRVIGQTAESEARKRPTTRQKPGLE